MMNVLSTTVRISSFANWLVTPDKRGIDCYVANWNRNAVLLAMEQLKPTDICDTMRDNYRRFEQS